MSKCMTLVNCLVMMVTLVIVETRPTSYDMQAVGSLRREVRQQPTSLATEVSDLLAAAPIKQQHSKKLVKNTSGKSNEGGLYKQFGSDADGEKGYLKKSYSNGNHGYKNFDTFHKTIGDRYGFEEHRESGKGSAADSGKHQAKSKHTKRKQSGDHEGAGTDDVESYYSGDEGGDYSGYSGGDGGDGESSSYNDGSNEGYSESYSSGDEGDSGDGGDGEAYSSGESYASSGEDDGSYY